MKKFFGVLCILILMCAFVFSMICYAAEESDGFTYFADASSYTNHYHGVFGGVEVVSENSVRVLANVSSYGVCNTGFMLKKDIIESMVAQGYEIISFKVTTQGYESNSAPGYVDVYASELSGAQFQPTANNAFVSDDGVDVIYSSGSVVEVDIVKLMAMENFTEGLKFILTIGDGDNITPVAAPAYLVLSDFQFTMKTDEAAAKVFEWFSNEASYTNHYHGVFGGVEIVSENSVRVLANVSSYGVCNTGFMLKKDIIESMVAQGYEIISFKVTTQGYESNSAPGYVDVYASELSGAQFQPTANNAFVSDDGVDVIYSSGSVVEVDIVKLMAMENFTEGLKFVLTIFDGDNITPVGAPAYLIISDFSAVKKTVITEDTLYAINTWFADSTNYASHMYGGFGGMTRITDDSVRILCNTTGSSNGHIGFLIRKEVIDEMVEENYTTLSFKVTTQAYESNSVPGYVDVYVTGVNGADYQTSTNKAVTVGGGIDIIYPSGSVVEIDLIKLLNCEDFREGLKFVLPTRQANGSPAGVPAYLVMSDFVVTRKQAAESPFEQLTFEESYGSHANGKFGSVSVTGNNTIQILATDNGGTAGFMLTRGAVNNILKFHVNQMTFTLNTSAYNSESVPGYIVLDAPANDYIENAESVAVKVEDNKYYFASGTEITLRLEKLYADITRDDGLKFTLLNDNSFESGSASSYLSFDNITFAEKWTNVDYDLVCSNGDFYQYYVNEATWAETTKKSMKAVAEAGFEYIDLSLYHIRNDSDLMKAGWEEIVLDLKAHAEALGVEFRMAHSPGYTTNGSDEWVDTNKRCVDICKMLGIERIVVHPVVADTKDAFFVNNARYFGYILPYAAENGIDILCENSTSKNTGSAWFINDGLSMREFIKYVQNMGYSNFHGCWDVGHANCEGDQYMDILALGDEMHAIHFHDNLGTDTHMIPYYGNMDIDSVMRALKVIGYSGDFTLETDGTYRIGSTYTGPALQDGLNPFTSDRFEEQKIIYQIMTYILKKYDCDVLFETGKAGYVNLRAVTDVSNVSIIVASYDGKNVTNVNVILKNLTTKNAVVPIPVSSGDKVFVLNDKLIPISDVYTVE